MNNKLFKIHLVIESSNVKLIHKTEGGFDWYANDS